MENVLITGATRGIGRVAAKYLAERGFRIIAAGRTEAALASLAEESGGAIDTVVMDVTDKASIAEARDRVGDLTGGAAIDVLINNAGYGQGGPVELVSDEEIRAQYDTNIFGLLNVTRAFLPQMRDRRRGKILNVSSIAGHFSLPFLGVYSSTKHALEALSDSLRLELEPFGISVVLIKPGAINTEFGAKESEGLHEYATEGSPYARVLEPFIRWHSQFHPSAPGPEEVAKAIERALSVERPRDRYFAPPQNVWIMRLRTMTPTRFSDAIARRMTGIGGVKP